MRHPLLKEDDRPSARSELRPWLHFGHGCAVRATNDLQRVVIVGVVLQVDERLENHVTTVVVAPQRRPLVLGIDPVENVLVPADDPIYADVVVRAVSKAAIAKY